MFELTPTFNPARRTMLGAGSDAALYQAKNTGRNRVVRADTTKA